MKWSLFLICLTLGSWTCVERVCCSMKDYTGYQHWLVKDINVDVRHLLRVFERENDVVIDMQREEAEILIPPRMIKRVKRDLNLSAAHIEVKSTDFQVELDKTWERFRNRNKRNTSSLYHPNDFNEFEAIETELRELTTQCNNGTLTCLLFSIGKSHEGRNLTVIKISNGKPGKLGIWLGSLLHAREWITGAVVMKTIRHLVFNYGTNQEVTDLLDKFDFYALPVSNPDGYVFTWTGDRMWRKNRRKNTSNGSCDGVDLNRNFDFKWGYHLLEPRDKDDICGVNYIGPSAASEPETEAIQKAAKSLSSRVRVWISYHGSRAHNVIMMPYSWSCDVKPHDGDDMYRAASVAVNAILKEFPNIKEKTDAYWRAGRACDIYYIAKGTTLDYVYAVAHIKYSYTPELRGPSFNPPPSAIEYNFRENWIALSNLLNEVYEIEEEVLLNKLEIIKSIHSPIAIVVSNTAVLLMYVFIFGWICCYTRRSGSAEL